MSTRPVDMSTTMDMFERPLGTSNGSNIDPDFMGDISRVMDNLDIARPQHNGSAEEPEEEAKEGGAATPEPTINELFTPDMTTTVSGVLKPTQSMSDGKRTFGSDAEVPATDNPGLRETRPMIEPTQGGSGSTDEGS
jgi:hypothetical protein